MKLISQEYGLNSVELTFADNAEADDAETLLFARLPFEVQETKSVAWNRYWALQRLHDELGKLVADERSNMEAR